MNNDFEINEEDHDDRLYVYGRVKVFWAADDYYGIF